MIGLSPRNVTYPKKNRNATTPNAVRPCDIINFGVKKYVFVGPLKTTDQ